MATKTKKPAKRKPRPTPDRISLGGKLVRSQPILRLRDSVVDGFDYERPVLLEPVTEAVINAETTRVILTRDAVANAVRALVRLAARWEIDPGFSSIASADLRNHNLKDLEAVVAILQINERSAPIAKAGKYRVTNDDANLLVVYHSVKKVLEGFEQQPIGNDVPWEITWMLGNSYRIPVETIERHWTKLVKEAAPRPNGKSSKNWVSVAGGPVDAAKKLLGVLGVAGQRRIGALLSMVEAANLDGQDQNLAQIFEGLNGTAYGAPISQEQLDAYIARVWPPVQPPESADVRAQRLAFEEKYFDR